MTDKTLSKARGLNSLANPRDFKGAPGRRPSAKAAPPLPEHPPTDPGAETTSGGQPGAPEPVGQADPVGDAVSVAPVEPERGPAPIDVGPDGPPPVQPTAIVAEAARSSRDARTSVPAPTEPDTGPAAGPGRRADSTYVVVPAAPVAARQRAVTPGPNRKRRELTVPTPIADALDRTGINPADVVMAGFRRHAETIYAGGGGRMQARGRTRLRLSISDAEFEELTRLGQARGWNRSEVVAVLLAMELFPTGQGSVG